MNAKRLFPHPRPRAAYIESPARGSTDPTIHRSTVFADNTDAAYFGNESSRYVWADNFPDIRIN